MYDSNRSPVWFTDAKWSSGILLTLLAFAATLSFVLGRATEPEQVQPVTERILALTLLPEGPATQAVTVRQEESYRAGELLELLPGTGIHADPSEIPGFSAVQARNRIAGVLTSEVLGRGAQQALAPLQGSALAPQLEAAVAGPVTQLVRAQLAAALLPAGLDNGSRLADWRLQARQQPGQDVQPIVGVFVRVDPAELESLTAAETGALVVDRLADSVLSDGLTATQELVSNANLLQRLTDTVSGPASTSLHGLIVTLLLGYTDELETRLDTAQAVLRNQGSAAREPSGPSSLLPASQLAGLSVAEANELIISQLAELAWRQGSSGVLAVSNDPAQAGRIGEISWLLDALSEQAHGNWVRSAWLYGLGAVLLALLLAVFSGGWGRLFNPGLAVLLAAGSGTLLSRWLLDWQQSLGQAGLPPEGGGVLGQLAALTRQVAVNLPQE
jgi:hypothetical protein